MNLAFWRDLGIGGTARALLWRLPRQYYRGPHPRAKDSPMPEPGAIGTRESAIQKDWDALLRKLQQKESGVWERYLWPWVRRIEPIVFGYLDRSERPQMGDLAAYLDGRLASKSWMERLVTGSNVSAVAAGKAAWALLRYAVTGANKYLRIYRDRLSRAHRHIDLAFTKKGAPYEGSLYGLFGLRPIAVLSYLQRRAGLPAIGDRPRLSKFIDYLRLTAVGTEDFALMGDAKVIDFDGSFPSYRYYVSGSRPAGEMLKLIGPANARPDHYARIYGDQDWRPFPEPTYPTGRLIDTEKQEIVIRGDGYLFDCVGNVGVGRHHLHLGSKPGGHSIWRDGEWIEREERYTNAWVNRSTYDPRKMNAPDQGKLTEEARLHLEGGRVRVDTGRWTAYIDTHQDA